MSQVNFACTALKGTNKSGDLKPDADGYYEVVLGGLNVANGSGAYYPLKGAESVFQESAPLMRRIASGNCRGEYGHPYRLPGQTPQEYLARCMKIQEDRIAFHIASVRLDDTILKGPNGQPIIAILGKIRPCGPFGPALEDQLRNSKENVCFSIRALTGDSFVNGIMTKVLRFVLNWDYVNEPGIAEASKWKAPTLECFQGDELILTQDIVETARLALPEGVGMEAAGEAIDELLGAMGWVRKDVKSKRPASAGWSR